MYAVVRTYTGTGAKELFDLLIARQDEVLSLLRAVKGFRGYMLARTADGGFTVTTTEDKAGADESVEKARDWVKANGSQFGVSAPTVLEGAVAFRDA